MAEKEYIERDAVLDLLTNRDVVINPNDEVANIREDVECLPAADVRPVPEGGIGEMSDGYHTFNGLYYQRMVLFAALVNAYNDRAWKSWKHEDGKPCFDGGWFIVGIDTPKGSYTYHYEDKYWNWFECEELPVAKHWDGHTEDDVTRLLSLDVRPVVLCRDCKYAPSGTDNGEDQGFGLEWPHDEWPEDNPCPCKCADGWYSHKPAPDFFCAAGEKREES